MYASAPVIRALEQVALDRWRLCLDNGCDGVTVINVETTDLTHYYLLRNRAAQAGLWLLYLTEEVWAMQVAAFIRQQQQQQGHQPQPSGFSDITLHANGGALPPA